MKRIVVFALTLVLAVTGIAVGAAATSPAAPTIQVVDIAPDAPEPAPQAVVKLTFAMINHPEAAALRETNYQLYAELLDHPALLADLERHDGLLTSFARSFVGIRSNGMGAAVVATSPLCQDLAEPYLDLVVCYREAQYVYVNESFQLVFEVGDESPIIELEKSINMTA